MSLQPTGLTRGGDAAWSKPAARNDSPGATESPRAAGALGAAHAPRRDERAPDRASASCAASGTHTAVSSPARCSRARRAASRRSVLTRSPARCGISEGATTTHCWPVRRQATLDAVAARAGLIAEPQLHPLVAKLAGQPLQCCRRVRDPAVVSNLAPQAAFGYRHDDPVLVNIKPDIRDIIPMTRLLCMRLGTGQSGATLATCIL